MFIDISFFDVIIGILLLYWTICNYNVSLWGSVLVWCYLNQNDVEVWNLLLSRVETIRLKCKVEEKLGPAVLSVPKARKFEENTAFTILSCDPLWGFVVVNCIQNSVCTKFQRGDTRLWWIEGIFRCREDSWPLISTW